MLGATVSFSGVGVGFGSGSGFSQDDASAAAAQKVIVLAARDAAGIDAIVSTEAGTTVDVATHHTVDAAIHVAASKELIVFLVLDKRVSFFDSDFLID